MSLLNLVGALTAVASPANAEVISLQARGESKDDTRVPIPSHRHASPSAPWPWVDLDDEVDRDQLNDPAPSIPPFCSHDAASCNNCWTGYPQSRFPNWTYAQVAKSKIQKAITEYNSDDPCVIYRVDVDYKGFFSDVDPIVAEHGTEEKVWRIMIEEKRPQNLRVRGLFIENLSGPILQMLGTKFNIEPFYWSSSLNWIPSRFQTAIQPQTGDNLTITLTFLKSTGDVNLIGGYMSEASLAPTEKLGTQEIDTRAPLVLYSTGRPRCLVQDLLSVHLIRNVNGSTIISYHPSLKLPTTSASFFHTRIRFAGQSVYWQTMFQKSPDPTLIFLTFIWHALYAWDQAMENLYDHICFLESRAVNANDIQLTHELHVIRAHQLHYTSLLEDYAQHMKFIMETSNPMLDNPKFTEQDRRYSRETIHTECNNLLVEIERLKSGLEMQQRRLTNVMDLVFSSVNIQDSKYMGELTAANDLGANHPAMKQISYLTMVFLPASFTANFFGMNVRQMTPNTNGTLIAYWAVALPLTVLTAWIVTAFQYQDVLPEGSSPYKRLAWPVYMILKKIRERRERREYLLRKSRVRGGGGGIGAGQGIPQLTIMDFLEDDENDKNLGQKEDRN